MNLFRLDNIQFYFFTRVKDGRMELEYGAEVIDRNGKPLGTVDQVIRDTWTGEISKFIVRRKVLDKDSFLSPEDVLEATKSTVKLNVTLEELSQR